MAKFKKVIIFWNGQGGELDSFEVVIKHEYSIANALIEMVREQVVHVGDTFTIRSK